MPEFTEIFGGREITTVIIGTSKTVGYRKLASTQVGEGDSVVEIGCDLGITTKLLRQRQSFIPEIFTYNLMLFE